MTREEKKRRFQESLRRQAADPSMDLVSWIVYLEREFSLTKEQILEMPAMEFIMKRKQLIEWKKGERKSSYAKSGGGKAKLFR